MNGIYESLRCNVPGRMYLTARRAVFLLEFFCPTNSLEGKLRTTGESAVQCQCRETVKQTSCSSTSRAEARQNVTKRKELCCLKFF